jgi:CRISPR-associated protein Csh1
MIKTLYDFGKILIEKEPDWFMPWQDPFGGKDEKDKIVIIININNEKIDSEPILEAYKKSNIKNYLFREAKSNATNLVPTFYYQVFTNSDKQLKEIKKKIKKIKASIKNYKHNFIEDSGYIQIEKILQELQLDSQKYYLLTFKIDGKYFGEYEKYKRLFYNDAFEKYSNASNSENKVCSVTYEKTDQVWGRVNTLGFAVTDQAFSRNGFNTSNSYKMFPVSPNAVKILEGAKNYTLNKLSKNFAKLNYFIIPHCINVKDKFQKEILDSFIGKCTDTASTLFNEGKSIIGNEYLIYEIINDEKLSIRGIYYDIFFYQINNAQFLIKLHLADVLPSQFAKIFKVKNQIENCYDIITRWENKEKEGFNHYYLNFFNIKDFFSENRNKETIFYPFFFKVVEAVFYNSHLNEELVFKYFLEKIINLFKNRNEKGNWYSSTYKRSFVIYQFFSQLGLFTNKNIITMENKTFIALSMDEFIEQHKSLLNSDYAEGIFMLGCLVKKLLNIQYANLKSTPFNKRLNNLIVDNKEVQRIFRETKSKLIEYRVSYPVLEAKIFNALSDQNETAKLTRDKISYLFTGGLVMEDEFKKEAERRKKKKEAEKVQNENL